MNTYNLRLFKYKDGQQLRVYYNPVSTRPVKQNTEMVTNEERGNLIRFGWIQQDQKYLVKPMKENLKRSSNVRTLHQIKHSQYVSRSRTINRVYEISRSNTWEYFITLTFSPKKVIDRTDYNELSKKVGKWLNNLKRIAPKLRYMVVPELHKDGRSWHFHGLITDTGDMCILDSLKIDDKGRPIYNIHDFKYGWSTATKVSDNARVSSYITKYITKDLISVTVGRKRYWASRNLDLLETIEYNLPPEEIEEIVDSLQYNIVHMKTLDVKQAHRKIKYIELKDCENF